MTANRKKGWIVIAKGKYHYWLTEEGKLILGGWARDGLTDQQIADKMGISRSTLSDWKVKYPDISDTLKNNKDIIDRKVENALLENALGSKQVETIEEAVKDSDIGKVELKVVKMPEELVCLMVIEAEIEVFRTARADWMKDIKR